MGLAPESEPESSTLVVRASRPHFFECSGIVQAGRLHHNRTIFQRDEIVGQPSRLPGGWKTPEGTYPSVSYFSRTA